MSYLTAKEQRVEKAWNKHGLSGLRSSLLKKVAEKDFSGWGDEKFVKIISAFVFSILPMRDWEEADTYIEETCGLAEIDLEDIDWEEIILRARLNEENLREDIGDE